MLLSKEFYLKLKSYPWSNYHKPHARLHMVKVGAGAHSKADWRVMVSSQFIFQKTGFLIWNTEVFCLFPDGIVWRISIPPNCQVTTITNLTKRERQKLWTTKRKWESSVAIKLEKLSLNRCRFKDNNYTFSSSGYKLFSLCFYLHLLNN